MAGASSSQVTIAQKTWEMSNNIMEVGIVFFSLCWDMSENGGVENFSETLISFLSCCGIGQRWR